MTQEEQSSLDRTKRAMESIGFQPACVTLERNLGGDLRIVMGRDPRVVKRFRQASLSSLNGTQPPTQTLSGICVLCVPGALSLTLALLVLGLKTAKLSSSQAFPNRP